MEIVNNQYLKHIDFTILENWSVQYLKWTAFSYNKNFEFVKIGDFLKRNKTQINIQDGIEYKRVTVKMNNGWVFLRDIEKWENIGTKKQFLVSGWEFIMSKIDARNGAFGIVSTELRWAIVTNDFPTFHIDVSKINPDFFVLILWTKEFADFAQQWSSGTTGRQRIDMDIFLSTKIPLPSIKEQDNIAQEYNEKIQKSIGARQKTIDLEKEIESYLMKELGIEIDDKIEQKSWLKFLDFHILNRWDVRFLIWNLPLIKSKFDIYDFSSAITNFNKWRNNQTIRVNSVDSPKQDFKYIWMEDIEKETWKLLWMQEVKWIDIKSQTLRIPHWYIIFWKLRPYLNKYWINNTEHENIICSSEFFVFDIKDGIDKEYFKYCLSSNFVQYQITDKTSGARMPRINEDIFMNLELPLPPIEVQEKIVRHIWEIKEQIKSLKKLSGELKESAKKDFESEIFS